MFTSTTPLGLSDASVRGPGELHLINILSLSGWTSLHCQDTFISFEKEVSTEPLPTTSPTVPDPRLGTTSLYWLSWWWTGNDEIRALRDWVWGTNHPFVVVQEEAIITPRSDMRWLWWWWCGGVSEDPFIHRSLFHWGVYYLLLLYVVLLSDRYNITQDMGPLVLHHHLHLTREREGWTHIINSYVLYEI